MKYLESAWVGGCMRGHIAQINFCPSVCGLNEHAGVVIRSLVVCPLRSGVLLSREL